MEQGNAQGALPLFQQATVADPRDGLALHLVGEALRRLDRADEALVAFERSQAIQETAMNHLGMIHIYEARGDYERALQHGRRWTELEPTSPVAYAVMGRNLYELSRWDEAIAALSRSNSLQDSTWVRLWLGHAYAGKRDYRQAIAAYQLSLAMPDDCNCATPARVGIANAQYALGDQEAAVEWLDKAIAGTADPGEQKSLGTLHAMFMLSHGDYRQAAADLRDVHRIGVFDLRPVEQGFEVGIPYQGGPAELAGLQSGDVLVEFDGKPVRGVAGREFLQWLERIPVGDIVTVGLLRDGTALTRRVVVGVTPDLPQRTAQANAQFQEPALRIKEVKVTPSVMSVGQPFSLQVAYTATNPAGSAGKAAVSLSFSILSGGSTLLDVPAEIVESESGQPWKITKSLTATNTPGSYSIRIRLALGASVVTREVTFDIER